MSGESVAADSQASARDVRLHRSILSRLGRELGEGAVILDFGCGHGELVDAYRDAGFQAFGADVKIERPSEWLRVIGVVDGKYRIPFPGDTFDFICSNSVLEHVEDLDTALSEMQRVLKPGGTALHFFPARGRPIEPHVFVPFGGMIQTKAWLTLWALLGVRNGYQHRLPALQVAQRNYAYLHGQTFYRAKADLGRQFRRYFRSVVFADQQLIASSYGQARRLSTITGVFPFVARLYGALHWRCVFCVK
jgi:SAM-dependent methyltransferase